MAAPTLAQFFLFIQCAPGIWLPLTFAFFCEIPPLFCAVSGTLTHKGALLCLLRAVLWHFHSHKGSALFCAASGTITARALHCVSRCPSPVAVSRMGPAKDVPVVFHMPWGELPVAFVLGVY